jgi:hypothetical protein
MVFLGSPAGLVRDDACSLETVWGCESPGSTGSGRVKNNSRTFFIGKTFFGYTVD